MDSRDRREVASILEGSVRIEIAGGDTLDLGVGDLFSLPPAVATAAEHLGMILVVHGGSSDEREDVEAARERIHPATMAAEGPLREPARSRS